MAYIVIRTVKNRQYRYLQLSYREGDKVRTVSEYLGPVGGGFWASRRAGRTSGRVTAPRRRREPHVDEEAMLREVKAKEALKEAARKAADERFHLETGLRMPAPNSNPVPVDKPVPTVTAMMGPSATPSGDVAPATGGPAADAAESANSVPDK
jgi:hypothetical protein